MLSGRWKDGYSVCDTHCPTWRSNCDGLGLFGRTQSRWPAQSDLPSWTKYQKIPPGYVRTAVEEKTTTLGFKLKNEPAQHPDLNLIELVWDKLDRRVQAKQSTSVKHLWELLQQCWEELSNNIGCPLEKERRKCVRLYLQKVATLMS